MTTGDSGRVFPDGAGPPGDAAQALRLQVAAFRRALAALALPIPGVLACLDVAEALRLPLPALALAEFSPFTLPALESSLEQRGTEGAADGEWVVQPHGGQARGSPPGERRSDTGSGTRPPAYSPVGRAPGVPAAPVRATGTSPADEAPALPFGRAARRATWERAAGMSGSSHQPAEEPPKSPSPGAPAPPSGRPDESQPTSAFQFRGERRPGRSETEWHPEEGETKWHPKGGETEWHPEGGETKWHPERAPAEQTSETGSKDASRLETGMHPQLTAGLTLGEDGFVTHPAQERAGSHLKATSPHWPGGDTLAGRGKVEAAGFSLGVAGTLSEIGRLADGIIERAGRERTAAARRPEPAMQGLAAMGEPGVPAGAHRELSTGGSPPLAGSWNGSESPAVAFLPGWDLAGSEISGERWPAGQDDPGRNAGSSTPPAGDRRSAQATARAGPPRGPAEPRQAAGSPEGLDADTLAALINQVLLEQAQRHGVDLS